MYDKCMLCGWDFACANPTSIEVGMCADCRIRCVPIPEYVPASQLTKFYKKFLEKYYNVRHV